MTGVLLGRMTSLALALFFSFYLSSCGKVLFPGGSSDGVSLAQAYNTGGLGGGGAGSGTGTTGTGTGTGTGGGSSSKRLFVTVNLHMGNLGGLAGADAMCNTEASNNSLGGTWVAWLSTSTTDAISRITTGGPFKDLKGVTIFSGISGGVPGYLNTTALATIVVAPDLSTPAGLIAAWTGTTTGGIKNANTCLDWTDSTAGPWGLWGELDNTAQWTQSVTFHCNNNFRLLCIEQ